METNNLSGIFNGKVPGKEEGNIFDSNTIKMKQEVKIQGDNFKANELFGGKLKALEPSNLNHVFPKNKNKSKGGINTMLGANIKPKKQQFKDIKGELNVNKFFNMSGSIKSPKNNSFDKVNQMFGGKTKAKSNIGNMLGAANVPKSNPIDKVNTMFGGKQTNVNKKLDNMFGGKQSNVNNVFKNNTNVNNVLKNAFNTNKQTKANVNNKFNVSSINNVNTKISSMLGNVKGTENIGWNRAKQQVGLNPTGDFDGDKLMNMLDCNPLDKNKQGPVHTLKTFIGLGDKNIQPPTGVQKEGPRYRDEPTGQYTKITPLAIYETEQDKRDRMSTQTTLEEPRAIEIEIDPVAAGRKIWEGTKAAGREIKRGVGSVYEAYKEGREEESKAEEGLRKWKEEQGVKPEARPTPSQLVKQHKGPGLISELVEGAGKMHSNISRAAILGSPGGSQNIQQIVGLTGTPGMLGYMAAAGTRPMYEKTQLVSLGAPGTQEEKSKLIGFGEPTGAPFSRKLYETIGAGKIEEIEREEQLAKERLELERKISVAPIPQQVAPIPQPLPYPVPPQPVIPRTIQPMPQPPTFQQAQARPDVVIYSPASKRKVTYRRGPYKKRAEQIPVQPVQQVVYQPQY